MPNSATAAPVWKGLALAGAAAAVSLGVNLAVPTLSALLVAILAGVVLTNTVGVPDAAAPGLAIASKRLLRLGIVLLGLQVSLADVAGLGPGVLTVVVGVVVVGFAVAEFAGRALGLRRSQRVLIGAGISICGAAAVAAVDGALGEREDEDPVAALALVVLFGTLMIALVPAAGAALGLDAHAQGLWAGASVHEVAQVVAIGGIVGGGALQIAVVVKLARVLMLAPVITVLTLLERRRSAAQPGARRPPLVPLFVLGFIAASALRTSGVVPAGVLQGAAWVQTLLLSAAMFALGCGVRVAMLRRVGGGPLALAALTTLAVLAVGLGGVWLFA